MSIVTQTVTVNAAFLQEIKEVNEDLWRILAEVRRVCANATYFRLENSRIHLHFAELRDCLGLHFALEEAYGYFDNPADVAPHLCETAEELRNEHAQLYLDLCELVEFVERAAYRGRLESCSALIRSRFYEFNESLAWHEEREEDLISQAFAEDLGVGD